MRRNTKHARKNTPAYTPTSAEASTAPITSKRATLDNATYLEGLHDLTEQRFRIEQWRIALDVAVNRHNATCHFSCHEEATIEHHSLHIEVTVFRAVEQEFLENFATFEAAITLVQLGQAPWHLEDLA